MLLSSLRSRATGLRLARLSPVLVSMALSSCMSDDSVDDKDLNQDAVGGEGNKVYGSYSATHFETSRSTDFFAQLRVGGSSGTTLRLTDGATITIDGKALTLSDGDKRDLNLIGSYYAFRLTPSDPGKTHAFEWKASNGNTALNELKVAAAVSIGSPSVGAEIDRAKDLTVALSGSELEAGETFRVLLKGKSAENPNAASTESMEATAGMEVVLPNEALSKLSAGPATISVVRDRTESIKDGHENVGGTMKSKFYGKETEVVLK